MNWQEHVERLVAVEDIKQLKARYCRAFDTRDWDLFADCFTEDCVHSWGSDFELVLSDQAAYLEHAKSQIVPGVSVHHCVLPEIEVTSPTEARATWGMSDYVEAAPGSERPGIFRGYGYYHETYRKEMDGRWRICAKRVERIRLDDLS